VEREDGRSGKARQDGNRNRPPGSGHDCQAQRLSRFESDAMSNNPRRTELVDNLVRQVTRALRGPAREEDGIAVADGPTKHAVEPVKIVGHDAERDGFATELADRIGQDARVAVEDATGGEFLAGIAQLISSGDDPHSRPPNHLDRVEPQSCEYAGFPGGEHGPAKQNGLAAADIGARERDIAARLDGSFQEETISDDLRVLDHHYGTCAAGYHGSRRHRRRGARRDCGARLRAGPHRIPMQRKRNRAVIGGSECVLSVDREPIDVGPIEARNIDRSTHVGGQYATEKFG
jgi:hypothetical protein